MRNRISLCVLSIMMIFVLCSCSIFSKDPTVATVNGEEIKSSIYGYFLSSLKTQIGNVETVDGKPAAEYASKLAMDAAVKLYVTAQKAQELGVEFDDAMKAQFNSQISSIKDQAGNDNKYEEFLSKYGLNEETYELLIKYTLLQNAVKTKVESSYTPEQINEFYNGSMVNVQNILFKITDENNAPLSDDVIAEKKALADDALNRINNGESFSSLKAQYNEDVANTELGYMVSDYSSFVEPFVKASMKLEVGQVSEIVESSYGYHIIKRFNHVDNSEMFTASQTDILSSMFEKDVSLWIQASDVEYDEDAIKKVEY